MNWEGSAAALVLSCFAAGVFTSLLSQTINPISGIVGWLGIVFIALVVWLCLDVLFGGTNA